MVGGIIGDLLHVSGAPKDPVVAANSSGKRHDDHEKMKKQGGKSVKKVLEGVKHGNKAS
jgi:hypothetical protein